MDQVDLSEPEPKEAKTGDDLKEELANPDEPDPPEDSSPSIWYDDPYLPDPDEREPQTPPQYSPTPPPMSKLAARSARAAKKLASLRAEIDHRPIPPWMVRLKDGRIVNREWADVLSGKDTTERPFDQTAPVSPRRPLSPGPRSYYCRQGDHEYLSSQLYPFIRPPACYPSCLDEKQLNELDRYLEEASHFNWEWDRETIAPRDFSYIPTYHQLAFREPRYLTMRMRYIYQQQTINRYWRRKTKNDTEGAIPEYELSDELRDGMARYFRRFGHGGG